jgi:hypothetical protein
MGFGPVDWPTVGLPSGRICDEGVYPHRHHLSGKVRTFIDLLAQHSAE